MNIRLRELRKSQGKSGKQVSIATGISKNGIHILETNPNNSPMVRTLVILADYYGVSLDYLAGRTDDPAVEKPHGRWEVRGQDVFCTRCDTESLCNPFGASCFSAYCPNCGAKMDGGDDHDKNT
jgi:hypothetical protein